MRREVRVLQLLLQSELALTTMRFLDLPISVSLMVVAAVHLQRYLSTTKVVLNQTVGSPSLNAISSCPTTPHPATNVTLILGLLMQV